MYRNFGLLEKEDVERDLDEEIVTTSTIDQEITVVNSQMLSWIYTYLLEIFLNSLIVLYGESFQGIGSGEKVSNVDHSQ